MEHFAQENSFDDEYSETGPYFYPAQIEDVEDLENYYEGGYHPVLLGQLYNEQYKIIHKLGSGGFSTVWLARDTRENRYVTLKIVKAEESESYRDTSPICQLLGGIDDEVALSYFPPPLGRFWFNGDNGRHVCEVLPVLGPSMSQASDAESRMWPSVVRRVAFQATQALAHLHSRGICHGDFTSANVLFRLSCGLDGLPEKRIYELLGHPKTDPVVRYSGEPPEPTAPKYAVAAAEFLYSEHNVLKGNVSIIDFDQSFPSSQPPNRIIGTPSNYLAPEAIFERPGTSSDVWALGCTILRMRAGFDIFEEFMDGSPLSAVTRAVEAIGELPLHWKNREFDEDGLPVRDGVVTNGDNFTPVYEPMRRPLKDYVYSIVDCHRPAAVQNEQPSNFPQISNFCWKPSVWEDVDEGRVKLNLEKKFLKAISKSEADLLYDLLSKIFVFDTARRLTAEQILDHPWFQFQGD